MKKDKFLTLYAVLDMHSQQKLTELQNQILKQYPNGTQTMGIPFHISLGSFPLEKKEELLLAMEEAKKINKASPIALKELNHFNHQVIFIEPSMTGELQKLHRAFEGNYADGFPWHPHVTLFCGKEEDGKKILNEFSFSKMNSYIVGLELGEFFPTNIIKTIQFK
ncbi:MAG: 2'-5' RNA ligase family protein [Anaeroplasmataceae bacterium]|nr:2'-5' RNA ligase family protein [Anaeroplasmataceae bacterium]